MGERLGGTGGPEPKPSHNLEQAEAIRKRFEYYRKAASRMFEELEKPEYGKIPVPESKRNDLSRIGEAVTLVAGITLGLNEASEILTGKKSEVAEPDLLKVLRDTIQRFAEKN